VTPGPRPVVLRAGLARRWAALVYDAFLLAAVMLVAGFAVLPLVNPSAGGGDHPVEQLYVLPAASRAFLLFYYAAVFGIYCIGFWSNGRRTLAMKTWGLALARPTGGSIDMRLAIRRFAAAWIGPAASLAGYMILGRWGLALGLVNHAWGWVDPERQFLHDRLAGTRIVRG
jgi:uncharacterized RDD family membrane protein YckC